jgi:hypothetical protein
VKDVTRKIQPSNSPAPEHTMASRDILTTELNLSASIDRTSRMPAWFEPAARGMQGATATPSSAADSNLSWLDTDLGIDNGMEVIEHHVPAALMAVFFGTAAACGA